MGVVGMMLAGVWMKFVRNPADHPAVNRAELDHIAGGGGLARLHEGKGGPQQAAAPVAGWFYVKQLLGNRMLAGVYLGQYCINVLTYFFLTWFPVYLVQARGMSILKA